ncbi:STAS domain-containing protein [Streptomyces sp. NPDC047972]|uniref:STAS domain-containing protein n=1 Tax=Streptomyces sp. NPDC047972 TaxID=3365493 RepID=UPI003710E6CA
MPASAAGAMPEAVAHRQAATGTRSRPAAAYSDRSTVDVLNASAGGSHIYSAPGGDSVYREATGYDGTAVLVADGEFDMDSVVCLQRALTDAQADGAITVRLNVSGVTFADSSFLHAVLRARQGLDRLTLIGPLPDHLHQLLDLTGTAPLLPVEP